ncbi:MAG TPA: WD40 repeat domain-containing protein, partial [Thermoguttaceae bacterium]|nr:WD40 repeat domain-containing protein [Thermoguttaceae bacterium]
APDGIRIMTGSADKTAVVWNAKTGKPIRSLEGHTGTVYSVAFSPEGNRILTGSGDKTAVLWNARTFKPIHVFEAHSETVLSVAFSRDGKEILTASRDKDAILWDATTGQSNGIFSSEAAVVKAIFSPHGPKVLTASTDGQLKLWNALLGKLIKTFSYASQITSAAFDAEGRWILVSFLGRPDAILLDAERGTEIRSFRGHTDSIHSVAFSPDNSKIATASGDGTCRLWDPLSGRQIAQLWHLQEGRWFILTSEGYFDYDGSRETLELIRYRDPATGQLLPPDRTRQFHSPDLVRQALQGPNGKTKEKASTGASKPEEIH